MKILELKGAREFKGLWSSREQEKGDKDKVYRGWGRGQEVYNSLL